MRHLRNLVDSKFYSLTQFFPVALSAIFLLVYAKCNFSSVQFLVFPKISMACNMGSTTGFVSEAGLIGWH